MRGLIGVAMVAALSPGLAGAQEPAAERDLCSERPGLGTSACTVEPGRILVETGLADWTHEHGDGERIDTVSFAATELRFGVADATEVQLSWTPYGHQRTRDGAGTVEKAGRVGDVRLAAKQNLSNPDGRGLSFAVLPFVTLPVGRMPIGMGDWGAGLLAPLTYDLTDAIQLEFTPEVDAAVNADGHGRHLAYSGVVGAAVDVTSRVAVMAEVQALHNHEPYDHATSWVAGLSAAWQPRRRVQFDVGAVAGLDHDAPALRIYGGFVTQF
ncbi:transporter [Sphingomonas sp. KR1UV-12]|uniref:Transporter n=1 Tax=Sphingomonas aurea TaxID=3063994 RepID=A0ABT9EG54_9SPHN|nr:transporter [Sphingomonas sp. KR1UV-12]MDP1025768.1 transporter [Sphingomonas sp. KR1UV-12]